MYNSNGEMNDDNFNEKDKMEKEFNCGEAQNNLDEVTGLSKQGQLPIGDEGIQVNEKPVFNININLQDKNEIDVFQKIFTDPVLIKQLKANHLVDLKKLKENYESSVGRTFEVDVKGIEAVQPIEEESKDPEENMAILRKQYEQMFRPSNQGGYVSPLSIGDDETDEKAIQSLKTSYEDEANKNREESINKFVNGSNDDDDVQQESDLTKQFGFD